MSFTIRSRLSLHKTVAREMFFISSKAYITIFAFLLSSANKGEVDNKVRSDWVAAIVDNLLTWSFLASSWRQMEATSRTCAG